MALRVKEDNFEEEVLNAKQPVITEFYSDTCIPCRQQAVVLGELEDEYEDRIKTVKVNVNFDTALAEKYRIMASPTMLFFKEGEEVRRIIGLTKKEVLKDYIEQII